MADGVASTAAAEVSSAGQERQRLQRKDDKKSRSIFDVAPDFFDSCRLLESPLSVVSETTPISAIETLDDELASEEAENTASMGSISRWSCNTCKAEFESLKDQRSHFKSDIHRFNVKLSIAGMNTVKEEDFDESTSDSFFKDNDISSISGSEDEVEKGSSLFNDVHSVLRGSVKQKLFIRLQGGERVSLWKSLILNEAENIIFDSEIMSSTDNGGLAPILRENEVIEKLKFLIHEPRDTTHLRVVLLARGGHFAGCVLDGNSVVAHKTFHRYVIRAKAGKKQSSKDASGKAAHSAGASLRRHNELALKKEIQELLAVWKPYFDASLCVFIYAPSNNRQLFFRGEKPNFSCKHGVVRNVPLTVRRPTLKEAKRVYNLLTQVSYEVDEIYSSTIKVDSPQSVSIAGDNFPKSSKEVLVDDVENKAAFEARLDVKRSDISISSGGEIEEVCLSTPLHEASKSANAQKVLELLEQGLDPCVKDERGRTPYMVANDKEVRNTFRRFMAINLDKWDWHAANVPSALTKEMEEAQAAKQAEKDVKKKARAKDLKKLRKAREKKAQAEAALSQIATTVSEHLGTTSGAVSRGQTQSSGVAKISKEEELKMAQAAEREKRAAAAERRIAALNAEGGGGTNTNTTTSTSQPKGMVTTDIKCSCCETSLVGKVPFHRYNYKYCSTSCMHVHREMLEDG